MRIARALPAVLAVACLTLSAAAQDNGGGAIAQPAAEPPTRLYAVVHTRDNRGRVFCAIWRGREGYPTQRRFAAGQAMDRTIENREGVCLFEGVTPGEYALAAFHDENANNDLDRNMLGIPSEGTGASNDAYSMFGPPGYDDARFQYPRGTRVHRIDIPMHY